MKLILVLTFISSMAVAGPKLEAEPADVFEKVDSSTMKLTKQVQVEEKINYSNLIRQKASLESQLAKVNAYIAKGIELGLVDKSQLGK